MEQKDHAVPVMLFFNTAFHNQSADNTHVESEVKPGTQIGFQSNSLSEDNDDKGKKEDLVSSPLHDKGLKSLEVKKEYSVEDSISSQTDEVKFHDGEKKESKLKISGLLSPSELPTNTKKTQKGLKMNRADSSNVFVMDQEEAKGSDNHDGSLAGDKKKTMGVKSKKTFKCSVCEMIFNKNCNLQTHMRIHTGEKPHKCSICEKAFSDKSAFNTHFRLHSENRPFICSVCKKGFTKGGHLEIHMRIHTGERPYECSVCDKTFSDVSNLRTHMKTHTNERPFMCSICRKAFSGHQHLQRHIRIHTGEKPYECSVCFHSFIDKSTLNSHMRTHTGDKRHVCSVCNRGFIKSFNLKTHMRIHTGEKPHRCPVCDKAFSKSYHVKKHMRTHTKNTAAKGSDL